MKYSEHLEQYKRTFWRTCEGRVAVSKHLSKALAQNLGIPTPKTYELPANSFFKPDRNWGGRGCQEILDPANHILEERIDHLFDFKVFVIGGKVRMIQVDTAEQGDGKYTITGQSYYRWPDWSQLDADKNLTESKAISVDAPPANIGTVVRYAEMFGPLFSLPIRVDFMIDRMGQVYFNELCATPGLIVSGRVTDEADEWLGSFIN